MKSFEIGQPQWNPPVINVPEIRDITGQVIVDAIQGKDVSRVGQESRRADGQEDGDLKPDVICRPCGSGILPRQEAPFMSIDMRWLEADSHRSKTCMNRGPFVKDPGRRPVSGSPGHEPLS